MMDEKVQNLQQVVRQPRTDPQVLEIAGQQGRTEGLLERLQRQCQALAAQQKQLGKWVTQQAQRSDRMGAREEPRPFVSMGVGTDAMMQEPTVHMFRDNAMQPPKPWVRTDEPAFIFHSTTPYDAAITAVDQVG